MKLLTLLTILVIAFFIFSCLHHSSSDANTTATITTTESKQDLKSPFPYKIPKINRFFLTTMPFDFTEIEIITIRPMSMDETRTSILTSNQILIKKAELLDIKCSISDKSIDNGIFILNIESANAKNLRLEIFDEEGFGMVANHHLEIQSGHNYKALNLKSMNEGTYILHLNDETNHTFIRTLSIP